MYSREVGACAGPTLLVFAGPNGSGKSTATKGVQAPGVYVNADELKRDYRLTDIEAAEQAEKLREKLLAGKYDFAFETVLSTRRNLDLMRRASEAGYNVRCIYVLTCNADINVARVKTRVAAGGHDVSEDKIRSRYSKALALLPEVVDVCDEILVYDNSVTPELIFFKGREGTRIEPNDCWTVSEIRKLIGE
ncbi:MAG: zeta toxin family protein [Clostridiales Family XIII bacterium]|jgi:predicted ABC-type ATPase|nr:zeta toxin family protein [Clostridiales Family XIII bacterium]